MWIQHNHPNTIVLCMHVGIITTLDQRTIVTFDRIKEPRGKVDAKDLLDGQKHGKVDQRIILQHK
jgi:hypothetical protein